MDTATLPKAYSYIRFSTPEQLKGDSLRRQTELSEKYALENNLNLDKTLTFRDLGVSAFNRSNLSKGRQLRAFLDAIDQGVVLSGSYLLVESLDRLSRAEILDAFEVFTGILNRGITVVTLADNMEYSKDKSNNQFGDLILSISIMARAHEESLTKSKRLKAAWDTKRKNIGERKLTRTCPAWLMLNANRTEYEPIPEKIAIVRQIVDLMMSGMGKDSISKKLNQDGIPSIGNKNKGQTWFPSYIVKIVNSRALIGEFQPMQFVNGKRVPAGEPITDYFPRAISDEQYALLRQLVSERGQKFGGNRGKFFSNLFSGFVKCAYCGSTMTYVNKGVSPRSKSDSGQSRFLVCSKAKRGAGCHYLPWTYKELEESFIRLAKGINFKQFVKASADQSKAARSIGNTIVINRAIREDIVKRKENLLQAIEGGATSPRSVLERIVEYEINVEVIDTKLANLENELASASHLESISKNTLEVIKDLLDQLQTKEGEELYLLRARINESLRRTVRELVLYPGGEIITIENANQIKDELLASGRYSAVDVERDEHVMLATQPRKHDRHFVIKHRDRVLQMLKPDHAIPEISDMLESPEMKRERVKRVYQKFLDDKAEREKSVQ